MGKIGGAMSNLKDINEADMGDLSPKEKAIRGISGGVVGGLQGLGQRQMPQQGGQGAQIIPQQPQQYVDFSQIGQPKRNLSGFYGA